MELIKTSCVGREIELLWQPKTEDIPAAIAAGYIPIEMAEGGRSFVDFRKLDHHNNYSELPAACVSSLQYYNTVGLDKAARLIANHADADCVMTGISLLGLLPYNKIKSLCNEVGVLDTEPLLADESAMLYVNQIKLWKSMMTSVKQSGWSWLYGVQLFLDIFQNETNYAPLLAKLKIREQQRRETALRDYENADFGISGKTLAVVPSHAHGSDVQFGRLKDFSARDKNGWKHWCIASYLEKAGAVFISCPCKDVAEAAFGKGGLLNVFPSLPSIDGAHWGGRESVGGSPRNKTFPVELMPQVLKTIDDAVLRHQN